MIRPLQEPLTSCDSIFGAIEPQGARRNLTSANSEQKSAAERLSEEFGNGCSTIRRDACISEAFEKFVANCGRETRQLVLARTSGVTQVRVLELARRAVIEQREFVAQLKKSGADW